MNHRRGRRLLLSRFWLALAVAPAGLKAASPLLASGAVAEKIAGGFGHCEGPAWHSEGFLLFCNPPHDRMLKLDAAGAVSTFRSPCGRATAIFFDPDGRIVVNESHGGPEGTRRVTRREKSGDWVTLADRFDGKRLNSPNDLAIDGRGRIFFTDPRYSARETMELDHESVYRIDPPRALTRLATGSDLVRPNGILVSPDSHTLYVADNPASGERQAALWAFDLDAAGNAENGRKLHVFPSNRGIDGMTFDEAGRIWATAGLGNAAGIYVFEIDAARTTAARTAFFPLPETPTNCTFGGARRNTLYITTDDAVFRLRTAVHGSTALPGK